MAKAAIDLPKTMMATVARRGQGCSISTAGLNSIPTDTKNSTANASRRGRLSSAARWLSSDSARIMPAKKAPSAKETPNRLAAPKATPRATTSTARRNSSREPVCAVQCSSQGIIRRPITSIRATKAVTFRIVIPTGRSQAARGGLSAAWPRPPARAGSRTSARTMARSSTINQPTAMRPRSVWTMRRSCRARSSTTVLATESARPNTRPDSNDQPSRWPSPIPSRVATVI